MNDISLTSPNWTPIGQDLVEFQGEFDGQGFFISDLSINKPSVENVGFFGKTIGATIENLRVEGPLVYGFKRVGGLVGLAYGGTKIRNCETNIRIETPEAGRLLVDLLAGFGITLKSLIPHQMALLRAGNNWVA